MAENQGPRSDPAERLRSTEAAAVGGDHNQEMALIHQIQDMAKDGSLSGVGKDLKAKGTLVKFDEQGQVTDIDFGQMSIHRMPDGEVTAIRRNSSGNVQDLTYDDGSTLTFNYARDNKTIDSMTQAKIGPGGQKTESTIDATGDRQISVDHDGNFSLRGILGNSVTYNIDGSQEIVALGGAKITGTIHGDTRLVDSVQYQSGNLGDADKKRSFQYFSDNQVSSFTDPTTGETFQRGTNYSDAGGSGKQYYHWTGDKGGRWDGTVSPLKDPNTNMSTKFEVTPAVDGRMMHAYTLDVLKSKDGIAS